MYNNGPGQTSATATFNCVCPELECCLERQRPLKYMHCDRKLESANSNSAALTRLRTDNLGIALARLEPFPPCADECAVTKVASVWSWLIRVYL